MAGPEHADLPPAGGASLGRSVRAFGRNQGARQTLTGHSRARALEQPRPQPRSHGRSTTAASTRQPPTTQAYNTRQPPTAQAYNKKEPDKA